MSSLVLSSIVLGLAWFTAVNLAASVMAWAVARSPIVSRYAHRGDVLLAVRFLPATTALIFVLLMFLPGHWRFEPRDSEESFGLACWILACAGTVLLGRSAWRATCVARAGWRLRSCVRTSGVAGGRIVYELPGFQGVSLAGVLRTRILVGFAVRRELTPAELDLAVAHELAHRQVFDNLKRFAMHCAPDLFGPSRTGQRIEERWRETAECAADSRAVDGDHRRAMHLASALVKVARLGVGWSGPLVSPAWSTLHSGLLLETRVRRLAGRDALSVTPTGSGVILLGCAIALVALSAAVPLHVVHQITESLLRLLP